MSPVGKANEPFGMAPLQDVRWAVDNIVVNDHSLICHGWAFVQEGQIFSADLLLVGVDGQEQQVGLKYGLARPDVAAQRMGAPVSCGFFFHGGIRSDQLTRVRLVLRGGDQGAPLVQCWTWARDLPFTQNTGRAPAATSALLLLRQQAGRAFRLIMRGQWKSFWSAVQRRLHPMKAPKANPSEIEVLVESLQPDTWLIIDHSLGGGANHYRNEQINECLARGHEAILWTFAPAILQFQVILHRRTAEEPLAYRVPWLALEAVLRSERVNTIMLNNCVSFPQPERVPLALLGALSRRPLRLIMCLHDFHWVCPSHFLLDNERRFCGVPDLSRCRQCLPAIQDQLASLYLAKDIDRWRSLWASLLNQATEVRCFSNSARALLNRAYPALPEGTVTVVPHRVHALPGGFDYPSDTSGAFCVAVVGAISAAKGSHVVKALSTHAAKTSRSLRLVVVGELHESGLEGNIVQTGPYKPEQLAGLLRTHGVHLALMPSVVAETFSYVTHELMQLGVPVMCFSLGAQAEAVARYTRGKVVPLDFSTPELLAALYAFKTELDSRFELRI